MARTKKTDILNDYERVRQPDADKLAELVERAIGKRTAKEFADTCGVNASTISRILNKKLSGPCSDELIVAIAANAAPGSQVSFSDLLKAHGVEKKEVTSWSKTIALDHDVREYISAWDRAELMKKVALLGSKKDDSEDTETNSGYGSVVERNAAEIIQLNILDLGGSVAIKKGRDSMGRDMYPYTPDFVLETNVLCSDGLSKWAFDIVMDSGAVASNRFNFLLAESYLNNPAAKGYRMTLATFNPDVFFRYLEEVNEKTIRDSISIMLLNSMTRKIDYEYVLNREGFEEQTRLFADGVHISPEEIYGFPIRAEE